MKSKSSSTYSSTRPPVLDKQDSGRKILISCGYFLMICLQSRITLRAKAGNVCILGEGHCYQSQPSRTGSIFCNTSYLSHGWSMPHHEVGTTLGRGLNSCKRHGLKVHDTAPLRKLRTDNRQDTIYLFISVFTPSWHLRTAYNV